MIFSNAGELPVILTGLRAVQSKPFPGILASAIKNIKTREIKSELFLVDEFFEDLKHNDSILSSYQGWPPEKLGELHRTIPASGKITLNLVFLYDAYEGRKAVSNYIVTKLEVCFSNGNNYPYKIITGVRTLAKPSNNVFTRVLQY